jgi:hypothetical protein
MYAQPSPHREGRRPSPATYICNTLCIYEIIDFRGITFPLAGITIQKRHNQKGNAHEPSTISPLRCHHHTQIYNKKLA